MNKYAFPTGQADADRLDIQHACYSKASFTALRELNLAYGQTVVDAGCGSGIMTQWLSHQVGPKGKVFAIDNDPAQLALCKERAQKYGLDNIEFVCFDFEKELHETIDADITYCKFVIHHLHNKEMGLKNLAQLTKKGGHLLVVEPINAIHWVAPHNDFYYRLFGYYLQYAKHKSIAANFGLDIFNFSQQTKLFSRVTNEGFQPITNDPTLKSYLFKGWEHIKSELIHLDLISAKETQQVTDELLKIIQSPAFTFGLPLITLLQSTVH